MHPIVKRSWLGFALMCLDVFGIAIVVNGISLYYHAWKPDVIIFGIIIGGLLVSGLIILSGVTTPIKVNKRISKGEIIDAGYVRIYKEKWGFEAHFKLPRELREIKQQYGVFGARKEFKKAVHTLPTRGEAQNLAVLSVEEETLLTWVGFVKTGHRGSPLTSLLASIERMRAKPRRKKGKLLRIEIRQSWLYELTIPASSHERKN